ncbi:MAG TPA: GreA/GreB family elongation factor [Candidatus Krumholzibacteria bacterium]|nr:GreA/GreB family elongation factor [Candidatus Krumholzibacteria bacterium]HPD70805.1 GreA/GreB family elongation factor [Candidatus Krumholzibacteria bacterium]HRY39495.1 GreA/GreB family elongation factor [Candidatus Krumholzibacteria bacterium]
MQDEAAVKPPSLIKLGKLANTKQFDRLADHWPEAVANPDYPVEDLLALAGQVYRLGEKQKADTFASTLIEQVETRDGAAAALDAAREAARQMPTAAPEVRRHLHRLYLATQPDFAELPGLISLLGGKDANQAEAARKLDRYCALRPGGYLVDYNFVMPGVVESINPQNGVVHARFEDRHAEYGPATLEKAVPKPADFFPALVLYDPERLRALAGRDPSAFVKLAIKADLDGELTYKNLKQQVTRLLGEKGWQAWWRAAREVLRHDPLLGVGAGSQPTFTIRRLADRYEARLRRRFDRTDDPAEKLKLILAYLDETARKDAQFAADPDLLVHYGNCAAKIAVAALAGRPALALAGLAVHARVAARGVAIARPNPRAALAVLERIPDRGSLAADLPEVLLNPALEYLRETQPDVWAQVWCAVLLRAGRRQCDLLARGLVDGGKMAELRASLVQALERPTASPDLVSWLWRSRGGSGPLARALQEIPELALDRCLEALLTMTHAVGHLLAVSGEERHLKVLEAARADLTSGKAQPLLAVIREASPEQLHRLRPLMQDNDGLNPALRSRLKLMLRSEHPSLFTDQAWPWEDETAVYTTEAGRSRVQEQLAHIAAVEIPAVAKQIGEAASHGDLSENSEYTAALEKRDQLFSRANTLEHDLKRAKLIDLDMAESNFVNIGTRVTAREFATGEVQTFTFLGPWEADSERGILNYLAPLALEFMGRRVGETVAYGEGPDRRQWEILSIAPGIS